jgi:hypothetical protein
MGLYLFKPYQPCSTGMWTIMQLTDSARRISRCPCICVSLHPYSKMPKSSRDSPIEGDGDIRSLLVQGARNLPPVEDLRIPPFVTIQLVHPPNGLPSYYLKSIASEMLALVRPATQVYMRSDNLEQRGLSALSIQMDFFGATIREAMIAGEAVSGIMRFHGSTMIYTEMLWETLQVSIAYALDPAFAAMAFRVRTKETLTKAEARRFTEIMEKSYLSTNTYFSTKLPGGAYIIDESAGSTLGTPPQVTIDINPFASVEATQGFLQYMPLVPGKPQGIRAIMVPDQSECELEMLQMPELDESGRMPGSWAATSS